MKAVAVLICALLLIGEAPAAAADAGAPAAAASGFYTAYLSLKQGGIPDAKARKSLEPFLSPALDRLIVEGEKAEASYAALTKNEVPPLLEGDIFTSMFEGATAFRVGDCAAHGAKADCSVSLTYESPGDKPQRWSDTAVLVQTASGWRVDDIDFGGNWPFANKGTLKENLTFAIHNAQGGGD